jgi:hypothetical protein
MERQVLVVLSGAMTRRLETVLLFSALAGIACTIALTSIASGIAALFR